MERKKKKEIIAFFDVSILIRIENSLDEFRRVFLENAPLFQRNGIEILILLEDPKGENDLLNFIDKFPFINFKLIVNREVGEVTNLGMALNKGIKEAAYNYIMILDPSVRLITDVVYQLRLQIFYNPTKFAKSFAFYENRDIFKNLKDLSTIEVLMVPKEALVQVKGFDENLLDWEQKKLGLCRRLELSGTKEITVLEAEALHFGSQEKKIPANSQIVKEFKNILFPKEVIVNHSSWGQRVAEVSWDWKMNKSFSQFKKYVSSFERNFLSDKNSFTKNFGIIALIQVRNESRNIPEILFHLDGYCDGIILLDDGSTDNSYEKVEHKKVLVKVKKKYKGYFDDLENRNILLRLANFYKSKWFFFIDADERFDLRFSNIRDLKKNDEVDVYRFSLVDVWDNIETYRTDMPDRNSSGITTRARMFRNKGSLQIHTNREIHFPAVPYSNNVEVAKILLLHYGNFDINTRERKYKLYTSQDSDGKKHGTPYGFLKDEAVVLKKIKEINLLPQEGEPKGVSTDQK